MARGGYSYSAKGSVMRQELAVDPQGQVKQAEMGRLEFEGGIYAPFSTLARVFLSDLIFVQAHWGWWQDFILPAQRHDDPTAASVVLS